MGAGTGLVDKATSGTLFERVGTDDWQFAPHETTRAAENRCENFNTKNVPRSLPEAGSFHSNIVGISYT
jgi:hypothetical protein